jgi:flagellar motor switch protein FliN/FliY
MKTFLEAWLSEAPAILRRELSNDIQMVASESVPPLSSAASLSVGFSGSAKGAFTITVDRNTLPQVLSAARLTGGESEGERNWELWRDLVSNVANGAVRSFTGAAITTIDDAKWRLGLPSAAYELRIGDASMRVAFTDQVQVEASAATNNPARGSSAANDAQDDLLLDIELEASLRFGSREMPLNEVLELGPGDVVELDRNVADPVDLLVGDKIVAHGEVVLVNGNFGLRIVRVAEPKKCLESIRCLF